MKVSLYFEINIRSDKKTVDDSKTESKLRTKNNKNKLHKTKSAEKKGDKNVHSQKSFQLKIVQFSSQAKWKSITF